MRASRTRAIIRILVFLHFCILVLAAAAAPKAQSKVTLVGLTPQAVEAKIGKPDEVDVLADSDEIYWTYKTPHGVLSVHFQNHLVIGFSPEDFPVDKILKSSRN